MSVGAIETHDRPRRRIQPPRPTPSEALVALSDKAAGEKVAREILGTEENIEDNVRAAPQGAGRWLLGLRTYDPVLRPAPGDGSRSSTSRASS